MNSQPRLSVLMITYNHERFIEQAVCGALLQETSFDYEIVIGEDGSTDRTREILGRLDAEHPGRLRLLCRDPNLGMMRNLMETYAACRGEFVALLEGDDYWTDSHKLQRQAEALREHPDWSACFHPVRYVNESGADIDWVHPQHAPAVVTIHDLFAQNVIQTCSVVFRRERMSAVPEWFTQLKVGDWPLFILLAETGPIGFLPDAMARYRQHAGGAWSKKDRVFHLQALISMFVELDRHTGGRYAAEIRQSRDRLLADAYQELDDQRRIIDEFRTSVSFRLGWALTAPFRFAAHMVRWKPGGRTS